MRKKFGTSLFIFRRDLRLEDNTGLIWALEHSERVIPAFIFTPEQVEDNPYKSERCLNFMLECLEDLKEQLRQKGGELYLFKGKPEEIVNRCLSQLAVEALIVNRDYTPYSIERDKKLEEVCRAYKVSFFSCDDALLHPPENTLKANGKPYQVFTPYFRAASQQKVVPPTSNPATNYFQGSIPFSDKMLPKGKIRSFLRGGRTAALKILDDLNVIKGPTRLSPYLKFTVCSPREVFYRHPNPELIRSLYWRDFFTTIAFFFPHVFSGAFYPKFDKLTWSYDQVTFQRWCEGATGFPIVDAGMRELKATGYINNRMRMIVASFLVKDLRVDWRWGEKYFAQTLVDYDPALNNGNWQWVASTGCDAQPYFRVFNPWTQQKKFDPECAYIKQWLPELSPLAPATLHTWYKAYFQSSNYPPPIVDHAHAAKSALLAYNELD